MRKLGFLLALGLLPLLGLGATGLLDYDEAAYGDIARAMLARGDWLVPVMCGEPWFEKPPLLYWTAALGMKLLGVGAPGVRLGTVLAGAAAPAALFALSRRPLGERAALAAAVALASALEFAVLARLAFTDMLLLLWLTVCVGALHYAFEDRARDTRWFALACLASALAVLTKGPIGLALPAAAALVELGLRRRLREALRPSWLLLGAAIVGGLGGSWYLALGLEQGFGFLRSLFLQHNVGRFAEPMQGHGGPLWYYVPVLLGALFPWSPLLPLAVARAGLAAGDERARYLRLFSVFSALVFVLFSLAGTKLPSYVAPVLPGCALLVGALVARPSDSPRDRAFGVSLSAMFALVALASLAVSLLPLAARFPPAMLSDKAALQPALDQRLDPGPMCAAAGFAFAVGALATALWWRERRERAWLALGCGALAGYTILFVFALPRVDAQINAPLRRLAARAGALTEPGERVLLLGLRHKASVCFYGARPTDYVSDSGGRYAEAEVFGPDHPRIGISGVPQLSRFEHTERLEVLERDGGYVLFRIPDASSGAPPPPP
jgi:4-amino-4-deoxy-L-arabinose transferase-like glycosyltransferase